MRVKHGWQYTVYMYGHRVKKIPHTRDEIKQILLRRDTQYEQGELEALIEGIVKDRDEAIARLQEMNIDRSMLGNPVFLEDGSYYQDRAVTLRYKLEELERYIERERQHKIIDEYITFVVRCWKNGFSERTYNLTKNNAYNSNGVILIDLGEITFSKEDIAKDINEKIWLKSWSFLNDLDPELKKYYKQERKRNLTLENLEKYW
ncbi:MAG: hypothetical protein ACLFVP_08470 [Candidatus Bathyarchaeia archaeon]